jgi:hypothetical protein
MVKPKKITMNAVSFIDLQLELTKHPTWRILEISRLNFGFKVILQKTTKEDPRFLEHRRGPVQAPSSSDFINRNKAPPD